MSKAYCPICMETRTDDGTDSWGFVWYSGAAICQRCQSVVEFVPNGQQENELECIDEQDENGEENEQNGLFR
jgi:hypothetical protein